MLEACQNRPMNMIHRIFLAAVVFISLYSIMLLIRKLFFDRLQSKKMERFDQQIQQMVNKLQEKPVQSEVKKTAQVVENFALAKNVQDILFQVRHYQGPYPAPLGEGYLAKEARDFFLKMGDDFQWGDALRSHHFSPQFHQWGGEKVVLAIKSKTFMFKAGRKFLSES